MAKRKKTNWNDVAWTRFEEIEPPLADDLPESWRAALTAGHEKWFANSIYVVRARVSRSPPPFGAVVQLTVMTHDHQPRHDWRELQWVKNELVGPSVEAVELYPSEDRVVDAANEFHLFCFPQLGLARGWLPFGFTARAVSEGSEAGASATDAGVRQRDFRPELRPDDVLHPHTPGADAVELGPEDRVAGRCSEDGSAIVFRRDAVVLQQLHGSLVRVARGECLKGGHVVFVAEKRAAAPAARPGAEAAGR